MKTIKEKQKEIEELKTKVKELEKEIIDERWWWESRMTNNR
tara:strand:- start:446 stop:568 length:123 start_codon:yes stop_codon:yes gene_type:complete